MLSNLWGLLYIMYPEISINYPLLIDTLNLFIIDNDLPRFDERFQTFLIDKNNAIILIGSPLYNRKMRLLYIAKSGSKRTPIPF